MRAQLEEMMMFYLLEAHDSFTDDWTSLPETYQSAETAIEAAVDLFEDNPVDHDYDRVRIKRTLTLCTLTKED